MAQFSGHVVKRPFARGSKSERAAVMLNTPKGAYVLRRRGGNAFADPKLDGLVGKHVSVEGNLHDYTLIISKYREVRD